MLFRLSSCLYKNRYIWRRNFRTGIRSRALGRYAPSKVSAAAETGDALIGGKSRDVPRGYSIWRYVLFPLGSEAFRGWSYHPVLSGAEHFVSKNGSCSL
jgi:hypothetical protein